MTLTESELAQYEEADALGVRLEMIAGQPYWEFQPNFEHQDLIGKVYKSVTTSPKSGDGCPCIAALDVGMRFPDDSLRRPGLAIFRMEPEKRELITLVPEAVVDVISKRSRQKDLEISPPFYLSMGVKDVLVYDPFAGDVHHFRSDGVVRFKSPKVVPLECGFILEV
jgi:Uma2 family endonuclease